MKHFHCSCGQRVFFDSFQCMRCGEPLGFDARILDIVPVQPGYWRCQNGVDYQVCNWVIQVGSGTRYCQACSMNVVVPNLEVPGNLLLWGRLEAAKRRLIYNLLSLHLPIGQGLRVPGLRFKFLEDQRRNPDVLESFVGTGHQDGIITINLGEADDVERAAVREQMQERYRTLLGHFRHETGHYYLNELLPDAQARTRWTRLFGSADADYAASLEAYYRDGPPQDWHNRYVSRYASAHAHEDWAETFAHYLHIRDALETAYASGLAQLPGEDLPGWILEWMRLSVTLNELNRSLGLEDPYPFVLTQPIIDKLEFVAEAVQQRSIHQSNP